MSDKCWGRTSKTYGRYVTSPKLKRLTRPKKKRLLS